MRTTARTLILVALMICIVLIATIIVARAETPWPWGCLQCVYGPSVPPGTPLMRNRWLPPIAYAFAPPTLPPPPVVEYAPPPSPPPLGWVYGPYTFQDPTGTVVVSVGADGLNVRTVPQGPVIAALANGTPLVPLQQQGYWILVAVPCNLAPTWTFSVTAGVPLSVCQ